MKKTVIFAIILAAIVIGVGITIKLANNETSNNSSEEVTTTSYEDLVEEYKTSTNPAEKIGDFEVLITSDNFEEEIENYKGVVMIDVFLPTCSHCQTMGPIVSEIAEEYPDYKIGKIDASQESSLATRFEVSGVPAFIFFKNGIEVDRAVGSMSKEDLVKKLLAIE